MAVPTTTGPPHSPAATLEPAQDPAASDPAASDPALDAASMARRIRQDIIRMAGGPEGAHAGGSLSCADLMAVLHAELLRPGDSFVLSKGHAAPALYSALSQLGRFPADELDGYAQPGSRLFGHPRYDLPGVEFATGSLGHGLGLSVGLALAEQLRGGDRRVYTVLGDGELQEGSVWEAALLAGHRRLPGLVAAVDRNGLQITGRTEETVGLEPLDAKFEAFGWQARAVDGHDLPALREALLPSADGPVVVIARTVKGRGVPFLEQRVAGHYAKLKPALVQRALAAIGRPPAGGAS
ncbi:transketolase [Dactylosporangium sp. NBC_01737]|uniref:transketolase n=1 Tax=Dactylosporangium sp. NBC_01737 TaxID=2975959 RepID=UPI002E14FC0F|nr:transketolase [Dactylosporangium sp. NBC_01737]